MHVQSTLDSRNTKVLLIQNTLYNISLDFYFITDKILIYILSENFLSGRLQYNYSYVSDFKRNLCFV